MNHPFQCIIFDLDGTLVNTVPDVRLALNHTLLNYGQCEMRTEEICALLGGGVRMLIQKAFAQHQVELDEVALKEAISCYLAYYQENPIVETQVYPGVFDVLKILRDEGIKLGICTNKPSMITRIVLHKLNLDHYFSAVLAGDEVQKPKPHGDHIHAVIRKLENSSRSAVMVGDSVIDKLSAQDAGIPFIGVRYGYDAEQFQHTHMINCFSELPTALEKISLQGNVL